MSILWWKLCHTFYINIIHNMGIEKLQRRIKKEIHKTSSSLIHGLRNSLRFALAMTLIHILRNALIQMMWAPSQWVKIDSICACERERQRERVSITIVWIMRSWGCFRVILKRHDVLCRVGKTSTASIIKIDMSYFHTLRKWCRVNCIVVILPIYKFIVKTLP